MNAELSCRQCRDALVELTAGTLPTADRQAVERHLASCADCRRERDAWLALGDAVRERGRHLPTDGGFAAGLARLRAALALRNDDDFENPGGEDPSMERDPRPTDRRAPAAPHDADRPSAAGAARGRRYPAIAAVAAIVLLSALVFGELAARLHPGPGATSSATPTPTLIVPATAPVPESVLLFGADYQTVYALSARDASTRWSVSVAPAQISGDPVEQDGVVYVSTLTGVEAFAAGDGRRLWQSTTAIQVEPGSIAGGVLYGASVQNGQTSPFVAALDVATGHRVWQVAGPGLGPAGIGSNLLPAGGVVLVGDEQGHVRALDATSGGLRWQVALQIGAVFWLTADREGTVYGIAQQVGVLQPALAFALDPQTQVVRWQHPLTPTNGSDRKVVPAISPLPVLTASGGALYVGMNNALVALDATSGSQRWQYALNSPSEVVVDQGIAYFGSMGGFYALHTGDGTPLWTHPDSNLAYGAPVLNNGVVFTHAGPTAQAPYIEQFSGIHLYAFRASDGFQYYRH